MENIVRTAFIKARVSPKEKSRYAAVAVAEGTTESDIIRDRFDELSLKHGLIVDDGADND